MMKWFHVATYDDTIQPKGRTAEWLCQREARDLERRGYSPTKIEQDGDLWSVYTGNSNIYPAANEVSIPDGN